MKRGAFFVQILQAPHESIAKATTEASRQWAFYFDLSKFASLGRIQARNEDVIGINSDLVNVFFSAVDRNNNFSTALAESDIALYEGDVRPML